MKPPAGLAATTVAAAPPRNSAVSRAVPLGASHAVMHRRGVVVVAANLPQHHSKTFRRKQHHNNRLAVVVGHGLMAALLRKPTAADGAAVGHAQKLRLRKPVLIPGVAAGGVVGAVLAPQTQSRLHHALTGQPLAPYHAERGVGATEPTPTRTATALILASAAVTLSASGTATDAVTAAAVTPIVMDAAMIAGIAKQTAMARAVEPGGKAMQTAAQMTIGGVTGAVMIIATAIAVITAAGTAIGAATTATTGRTIAASIAVRSASDSTTRRTGTIRTSACRSAITLIRCSFRTAI